MLERAGPGSPIQEAGSRKADRDVETENLHQEDDFKKGGVSALRKQDHANQNVACRSLKPVSLLSTLAALVLLGL